MRRKHLLNERATNIARGEELSALDRELTPEEKEEFNALLDRREEIDAELALIQRQKESAAAAIPGGGSQAPVASITHMHDNREDKPWGREIPAHATAQQRKRLTEQALGEYLAAVATAGSPGGSVDPRLMAAASGHNTGVPSEGGFLVRTEFSTFLLNRGMEEAQIAPLCNEIPVGEGADGIEAPFVEETSRATGSRWGGVRVYRRAEADTVDSSKVKLGMFEVRLEDLMAISYATERSLRDATSLGSIMSTAFASEFAFTVDDEILRGNGAGRCLGVLEAACLVTVDKETTQAADTFLTANISNMWARLHPRQRGGAVWLINHELEPQLDELSIPAGTAALEPRFVTYGTDGIMRIKGRPVMVVEQCSAVGDLGDVILGNFSQYALATKGGIESDESIHVRFLYAERAFRWIYRINGKPTWKEAVTPYKGTAGKKLSPFVTLQAR